MKREALLQSLVDGELTKREQTEAARLLESDEESKRLVADLQQLKQIMAGGEMDLRVPESREFYWSKIARGIAQAEHVEEAETQRYLTSGWVRRLIPAMALVAVVLLATFSFFFGTAKPERLDAEFEGVTEVSSDEMSSITFRSEKEKMTVVWVQNHSD